MANNPFNIPRIMAAVDFAIKDALAISGRDAVGHFKKSFDNEGFTDSGFSGWKKRENYTRRGAANGGVRSVGKYRKILFKSGKLKRSIKIIGLGANKVDVNSNMPYSAIHNQGLMGSAWGKRRFQMPKRQFMGNSISLERRTLAKFIAKINTAIKNA